MIDVTIKKKSSLIIARLFFSPENGYQLIDTNLSSKTETFYVAESEHGAMNWM